MNDTHDELNAGNETYYGNYAGQYIFVTPEENILIYLRAKLDLISTIWMIIGLLMGIVFFMAIIAVAVFVVVASINSEEHSLSTAIVVAIILCAVNSIPLALILVILSKLLGEMILITPEKIIRKYGIFKTIITRKHDESIEIGVFCDNEFNLYCADVHLSYKGKTVHLLDFNEYETKTEADSEAATIFRILSRNQTHIDIKTIE